MHSIIKRKSVYYFRVRVPSDMLKYFPSTEIVRSLHTGLYRHAKSLVCGKLAALEKVFMTIRAGVLTDDEIYKLVEKYKREQLSHDTVMMDEMLSISIAPESDDDSNKDSGEEDAEIAILIKDALDACTMKGLRKIALQFQNEELTKVTDTLLDERGMDAKTQRSVVNLLQGQRIDDSSFQTLCRAVAIANKEIFENKIQRNTSGDCDYDRIERTKPRSKTLKELITIYHAEKEGQWVDGTSTKSIHKRILHMFGDIRLDDIDREMCIKFRDDLKDYPFKNADFVTPWRELSKRKATRLSPRTQAGTMVELITLFKYAGNNDMGIRGNPATDLAMSKEDCKKVKDRVAYSVEELNRMIVVLSGVDRSRKPETFWIPLLLLYTGARSNEICQLRTADVDKGFIHIRNNAVFHQRTKNGNDRVVPVHSHLVRMGFLEYCEAQRVAGKDRLFSGLRMGTNGKWNKDYGKQYARTFKLKFLRDYTPVELMARDLHSFRKTFIDWFAKTKLVESPREFAALQSIVGHTDTEELVAMADFMQKMTLTVDGYGGGLGGDTVAFMEQLDYGIDISALFVI